ncbi:alpha/beta-Hydrolases superfamily protein [Striga asiatica]|uniref:Alpha/beta-Hydrolases superfamily protein n=1 Tax=Striga asiatica TaxID=4170 RepID=A0A5A7NW26_STRAF|nr:alpha/beta-Hydrolases superfamily protein [Striga asiatica]
MVLFSSSFYHSCSLRNPRHRNHSNTTPSPSNPCSSSPYSSHPNSSYSRPGRNWNFITFSGIRSIWKHQSFKALAMTTTEGNFSSPRAMAKDEVKPDHLLVLVHGIMGSPSDWTYFEAELKRRLGRSFLIYASSCNTYTKTFSGIDGAGKRLADEVTEVVKKTESLKKISFLAHSLGGLISRYAVAVLYTPNIDQPNYITTSNSTNLEKSCSSVNGLIAGLEAINFIALATPHLGVRGNKQLPFLLGMTFLEKLAVPVASIFAGRTGRQLFLTDGDPENPPLLLRMASDCEDGKFMQPPSQSLDGYEHIVNVEYCLPVLTESPDFSPEAAKAKEAAQNEPNTKNTREYHEIMEEEMIDGLQQLGWVKVDISFHSAFWPFLAHHNIHMKSEWFNNSGAGVVAHVADFINQQTGTSGPNLQGR